MKKTCSNNNEKAKSVKLNEDFRLMSKLFAQNAEEEISVPVNSTIFKNTKDEATEEIILRSRGIKPKYLDFLLTILYLASNNNSPITNEKHRFLLNLDEAKKSTDRAKKLFSTIFNKKTIDDKQVIDLDLESIVIETTDNQIFNISNIRKRDFYNSSLRNVLLDLAGVSVILKADSKEVVSNLLGYIYDENDEKLYIIIHPRLSHVMLNQNKYYKYLDLNKHIKLKHQHSKLCNFIFSSWSYQSNTDYINIGINKLLDYLVHDYSSKTKSSKYKIKSNFINKCIPELISYGWDIVYTKRTKSNNQYDDIVSFRHKSNPIKKITSK